MVKKAEDNPKVEFLLSKVIDEIIGEDHVTAVKLKDTKSGEISEIKTDGVFLGIGHKPNTQVFKDQVDLDEEGYIKTVPGTSKTNIPGIFAGGDFTTGPTYVIRAIASGRRAALAIEKYLENETGRIRIVDEKTGMEEESGLALEEETTEEKPRIKIEIESPKERVKDFREVEKGFTEEQARQEAVRCLRCDLEEK